MSIKLNKKGTIAIFLAIILSAIILIQTTYVILVVNLERGLTLRNAINLQVNTYLAQYDRQLLKTYGIYAFNINGIDDEVFKNVMTANGISDGDILAVSGIETFDTDDLRNAISVYYSYRVTGVIFNSFSHYINSYINSLDSTGLLGRFREFMSSDAADILINILDGAVDVSETIQNVAENLNMDDLAYYIRRFNRLIKSLDDVFSGVLDSGDGFDVSDLGFGLTAVENMEEFFTNGSNVIDDYLFHPFAVNYAAYNFDSCLEGDYALDGTEFSAFHNRNKSDIEYILTGETGRDGRTITQNYIYMSLVVKNIVGVYTDSDLRSTISGIANVLSIIVDVISVGTVILPEIVYESVIVIIYGLVNASSDLDELLDGEKIELSNVEGLDQIEMGYRDFVSVFMFFVSDNDLLDRMSEIINRDFDGYVTGISVVGSCNSCSEFELTRRYELYE